MFIVLGLLYKHGPLEKQWMLCHAAFEHSGHTPSTWGLVSLVACLTSCHTYVKLMRVMPRLLLSGFSSTAVGVHHSKHSIYKVLTTLRGFYVKIYVSWCNYFRWSYEKTVTHTYIGSLVYVHNTNIDTCRLKRRYVLVWKNMASEQFTFIFFYSTTPHSTDTYRSSQMLYGTTVDAMLCLCLPWRGMPPFTYRRITELTRSLQQKIVQSSVSPGRRWSLSYYRTRALRWEKTVFEDSHL